MMTNSNGNSNIAFNNFLQEPKIPYNILEYLIQSNSDSAEKFWKCLKHPTYDALEKPNLTIDEKKATIWTPRQPSYELEENFSIFLKPLVGNSTNTAEQQTQLRLFRFATIPTTNLSAIVCYEFDIITNEKTSMVYMDGILCERCDVLEALLLDCLNGKDIGLGSGYLSFDKRMSSMVQSMTNISNSKTFYGKSFCMALLYNNAMSGGEC